jgi:hypothetical protein
MPKEAVGEVHLDLSFYYAKTGNRRKGGGEGTTGACGCSCADAVSLGVYPASQTTTIISVIRFREGKSEGAIPRRDPKATPSA